MATPELVELPEESLRLAEALLARLVARAILADIAPAAELVSCPLDARPLYRMTREAGR